MRVRRLRILEALGILGLVLGAGLGAAGLAVASEEETVPGPLERALLSPPATGLLITFAAAESQAHRLGVEPGDVLVSFAGQSIRTLEDLTRAREGAATATSVEALLVRGTQRLRLTFEAGPLGIDARAVVEGEAPLPLPPATMPLGDLSPLGEASTETWFALSKEGARVGYAHVTRKKQATQLAIRQKRVVAAGDTGGSAHHAIIVVLNDELVPLRSRFQNVQNGWIGEGRLSEAGARRIWEVTWPPMNGHEIVRRLVVPTDLPVLPTLVLADVAARLPRKVGACLHFRPLHEGFGSIELPSALTVSERVAPREGEEEQQTWRVDRHELGRGILQSWWVTSDGRVARITTDGDVTWEAVTKEKALEGFSDG